MTQSLAPADHDGFPPHTGPVKVPSALVWVGSGAVVWWGGRPALPSPGGPDFVADRATPVRGLTYAGRMIVGILVATVGACFLAERSAVKRPT